MICLVFTKERKQKVMRKIVFQIQDCLKNFESFVFFLSFSLPLLFLFFSCFRKLRQHLVELKEETAERHNITSRLLSLLYAPENVPSDFIADM